MGMSKDVKENKPGNRSETVKRRKERRVQREKVWEGSVFIEVKAGVEIWECQKM